MGSLNRDVDRFADQGYDVVDDLLGSEFAAVNLAEIAQQMVHSIQTLLKTYTHVIEEPWGRQPRTAEAHIRSARGPAWPPKVPQKKSVATTSCRGAETETAT